MPAPESIHLPPFPALAWDGYAWRGEDLLSAWAGFQERRGPYSSLSSTDQSSGRTTVNVIPVNGAKSPLASPTPEQVTAYGFLKRNDAAVMSAVLAALFAVYAKWQGMYMYDDDYQAEVMPDLDSPDDLRRLVGLGTVHVLDYAKDGHAYVGFELGCTWDEEHGAGVLVHKDRVIHLGQAAASFNGWAARDDGGAELAAGQAG